MKILKLSILCLFFFFLYVGSINAQQFPPLPHTIKGSVYIDGSPAPIGTLITARLGEETLTEFNTTKEGVYAIGIETPGREGENAKLYVNGIYASEVVLRSGAVDTTIELSVSSMSNAWLWVVPLAIAVIIIIVIIIMLKYGKK